MLALSKHTMGSYERGDQLPRGSYRILHARAWRSTERLSLESRDDWCPECTRGFGMVFYLKSQCSPSSQPPIPPIPCFPSLMLTDICLFLALISLPCNQPPPCFPVLPKSQECSNLREALHHHDGNCQVHKINANFMASLPHSAKFYETEKTWNLMLWGHLVGREQNRLYPTLSAGSSGARFIQRGGDGSGYQACCSASWGPLKWGKSNDVNPGRKRST